MNSRYELHPEAFRDIDEIREFIAREDPDAADRVVNEIFGALDLLDVSPDIGHHRPDLTSRPLRFWRVFDYIIAYAPQRRPLWVVAVAHSRVCWLTSPRGRSRRATPARVAVSAIASATAGATRRSNTVGMM